MATGIDSPQQPEPPGSGDSGMQATPSASKPRKKSKAGRDLKTAIPVGAGLGGIVIASIAFNPRWWYVVVSIAIAIATWEVFKRMRQAGIRMPFVPMLLGSQATIWLTLPFGPEGAFAGYASTVVVVLIWRLFLDGLSSAPRNYLRDVAVSVFVLSWVGVPAAAGAMLSLGDYGAQQVIALIVLVVCSDVGGYVAGVLFGKRPMAPAISPKKSWEGFAGSMLFGVVGGVLVVMFLFDDLAYKGALLGIFAVITASLGDLVESQVKRDLGIKDMGSLLPGHGGLMDRLDSLLPSAVVAWLVFSYLVWV